MNWSRLHLLANLILALYLPGEDMAAQERQTGGQFTESAPLRPLASGSFSAVAKQPPKRDGLSQRAMFKIGGVALTGVGHLVFRRMNASKVYIPLASLGWGGYIYYRARTDPEFLSEVGFTSKGLGSGFRDATLVAVSATAFMAGMAARHQSLTMHRDLIRLFLLYPAWGLVQQFLVQGLVSRNLTKAEGWPGSSYVATPISAVLFAAVHLPNWKLTAGTFALGLAFTPIYLKHGNLWPLGLYHGWLGALFYFWVLEGNPWRETVGKDIRKTIGVGPDVDARGNAMIRLSVKF